MDAATTALRPIQMLCVAVGMGAVMVTGVRIVVDPAAPVPPLWSIAVVLVVLLASAWAIRTWGYAVPSLPTGLPRENVEATSLRYFASTTVLRTALSEAPVLVAFALSLVVDPRTWLPLAIAIPGSAALFWLHAWPSPRTAAAVAEGLEAGGAPSHLGSALGFADA